MGSLAKGLEEFVGWWGTARPCPEGNWKIHQKTQTDALRVVWEKRKMGNEKSLLGESKSAGKMTRSARANRGQGDVKSST